MSDKYHVEGMTDLSKIRDEAIRQSKDRRFGEPRPVVIHLHAHALTCSGQEHEEYINGEEQKNG